MKNDKIYVCRICGGRRGVIRRYNLQICWRCFKLLAPELGFRKYW